MKKIRLFFPLVILILVFANCKEPNLQKTNPGNYDSKSRAAWQKPEVVIAKLGDVSNKVIADIGAGTGYFSFRFLMKSKKVIAIDIDQDMLDLMDLFASNLPTKLHSKFETRLATEDNPNMKDDEVDIIVIINTLTYIDDRLNYLKKIKPTLKNNGRLLILNFKMDNTSIESPPKEELILLESMLNELEQSGYQIQEIDTTALDHQYIIIAN